MLALSALLAGAVSADNNESLVGWTAPVPQDPNTAGSN
ncbi:hypothetical protein HRUBRA_01687 [Pseudohaliea rubra DSM 19751]|uniref:Uncharacterized protein n=1 Tax=Pseudohaliea rubra DSM 19751 TaxID=1265313 RepID=A0A095VQV4_9GAMM|nr:hypothetical protein HRUBRA_01687 [Pseudohaliea rubra DSM 19751]